MLPSQKQLIAAVFADALSAVLQKTFDATVVLDRPKQAAHGDVACNMALQYAKLAGMNPREMAQVIVSYLQKDQRLQGVVDKYEIAGPGFINLTLSPSARQAVLREVLQLGSKFGYQHTHSEQSVLVEFVSANPTGPLHVGHGRQGALGDCLSNLLQTQGWRVHREFYYNDAGVQIQTLAASVQARAYGYRPGDADWPENAYNGDYIADIARDFMAKKTVAAVDIQAVTGSGDAQDIEGIRQFAVAYLRREQDIDLKTFGVRFDQYYLESTLYTEGRVANAVAQLVASGQTFDAEGALWLKSSHFGDDKDRVMRKGDGTYTYFVPDVAYHITKFQRGFLRVINIQGSDHHGTIARVRAGLQAVGLGIPEGYPNYILHKMVTVMRHGEEVKISKRAGSYVTLRDLILWSGGVDENQPWEEQQAALTKGRDAVRFFLVSRKADTEFVFDVDLALSQSDENPVYYVQYAHARICSILLAWGGDEFVLAQADLSVLLASKEFSLINRLAAWPDVLAQAAQEMAPHQIAFYLRDLAADFHAFYNAQRVLVEDESLKLARLALLCATRQVLRNGFDVLGISAPQRM